MSYLRWPPASRETGDRREFTELRAEAAVRNLSLVFGCHGISLVCLFSIRGGNGSAIRRMLLLLHRAGRVLLMFVGLSEGVPHSCFLPKFFGSNTGRTTS
jgi:hypothetical protein